MALCTGEGKTMSPGCVTFLHAVIGVLTPVHSGITPVPATAGVALSGTQCSFTEPGKRNFEGRSAHLAQQWKEKEREKGCTPKPRILFFPPPSSASKATGLSFSKNASFFKIQEWPKLIK